MNLEQFSRTEVNSLIKKRGSIYKLDFYINGKRIVKTVPGETRQEAIKSARVLLDQGDITNLYKAQENQITRMVYRDIQAETKLNVESSWSTYIEQIKSDKKEWLHLLWLPMKNRSRKKGMACELSYEDFVALVIASNGRCKLTGITFSFDSMEGCRVPPYRPSVDRIDNRKGYILQNVRIVCYCVNIALNRWGDTAFDRMARGYLYRKNFAEFNNLLNPGLYP